MPCAKEIFPLAILGTRAIVLSVPALRHGTCVGMKKLKVRRRMLNKVAQILKGSENLNT